LGFVALFVLTVALVLAPSHASGLLDARAERGFGEHVPSRSAEASLGRALPAVTPPAVGGEYSFMAHQHGSATPVTFDPCRPIHYVVRPHGAGTTDVSVIREAVAAVSAATGLRFVDDGLSTEAPDAARAPFQPDRYGDRWAPVLIAWSDPAESPLLTGDVAGVGGGTPWYDTTGRATYVTGGVTLDAESLLPDLASTDGRAQVVAIVMHELAHVVGLGHVQDVSQLMHAQNTGQTAFGRGDLAGLAEVGRGACVPGL
jgi:hypothetical protein